MRGIKLKRTSKDLERLKTDTSAIRHVQKVFSAGLPTGWLDDGIVAFVTNRSYLDTRQDDGFRKTL